MLQCAGQTFPPYSHTTKDVLAKNVNSSKVEKSCSIISSSDQKCFIVPTASGKDDRFHAPPPPGVDLAHYLSTAPFLKQY